MNISYGKARMNGVNRLNIHPLLLNELLAKFSIYYHHQHRILFDTFRYYFAMRIRRRNKELNEETIYEQCIVFFPSLLIAIIAKIINKYSSFFIH